MARLRLVALTLSLGLLLSAFSSPARAEPLRELADFSGVRDNVLVGYGLVVGLDGSGDQTMQTPFSPRAISSSEEENPAGLRSATAHAPATPMRRRVWPRQRRP